MLLVQKVDAKELLPPKRNCTDKPNSCLIGIASRNESIPKIEVIVTKMHTVFALFTFLLDYQSYTATEMILISYLNDVNAD